MRAGKRNLLTDATVSVTKEGYVCRLGSQWNSWSVADHLGLCQHVAAHEYVEVHQERYNLEQLLLGGEASEAEEGCFRWLGVKERSQHLQKSRSCTPMGQLFSG